MPITRLDGPRRADAPALIGAMLCFATLFPAGALAQEQVVIATTGGAYEEALREAWFDPFTEQTGIEVVTVAATGAEMRAKASAMVKTGNVSWDLYFEGEIQASSEAHDEVAVDLSEFCTHFADRPDLVEDACTGDGVRVASGATLMAYNTEAFEGAHPETWADMWDTEKFPGGRAFPNFNDPWRVMAAALLADGVPRAELFPLDIDRALEKLEAIRPAVSLWWKTGDQSVQGFRNGDYTIGEIWLTRANALKKEGLPVGWSYKAAFLVGDRVTLIKGAQNQENALRLIAFWLDSPKAQAGVCAAMYCTPPSSNAIDQMPQAAREAMPSGEEVSDYIVVPDANWINAHKGELLESWNSWIQ